MGESCTDEEAASLILKNCPQNPLEGGPAVSSKHVLHLKPTVYSEIHIVEQMYKSEPHFQKGKQMDNQCGNFAGKIQFPDLNKEFPLYSPMNNKPELIQTST